MSLESELAKLNYSFFFEEFTYASSKFLPENGTECELADNIIWLDDTLVVFQLKERNQTASASNENWFKKKVLGAATRQIRDTHQYLRENHEIQVINHRGHRRYLRLKELSQIVNVVCYDGLKSIPVGSIENKFHHSKTVGVIHVFHAHDYHGIVRTLLTPSETFEYLAFREQLLERWGNLLAQLPEQALLGQYLVNGRYQPPSLLFAKEVDNLDQQTEDWNVFGIVKNFQKRITSDQETETDYYSIIKELAKLQRFELKEFRLRYDLALKRCKMDGVHQPMRMASVRTGCGFLFFPLSQTELSERRELLTNFANLCKYDLQLNRFVGMSVSAVDNGPWYDVEWCYLDYEWKQDDEMETILIENNPFNKVQQTDLQRFQFK